MLAYVEDINAVALVVYNKEQERFATWFSMLGHPSSWTDSDCATLAQQLMACGAEEMKKGANVGVPRYFSGPKVQWLKAKDMVKQEKHSILLGMVAFALGKNTVKRLKLSAWIYTNAIGFSLSVYKSGVSIFIGVFYFGISLSE